MTDIVMARIPPRSHPVLEGHFPGHPIYPGAALLQEVIDAAAAKGLGTVREIRKVKFHRECPPGARLRIELSESGEVLKFVAIIEDELVLSGEFSVNRGER